MTGFGRSSFQDTTGRYNVEIRSLNSKGLELILRLPHSCKSAEPDIRQLIQQQLLRGKVECNIEHVSPEGGVAVNVDEARAKAYFDTFSRLARTWGASESQILPAVIQIPDVYQSGQEHLQAETTEKLLHAVITACTELVEFRIQEGTHLAADLIQQIELIRKKDNEIRPLETERKVQVRQRLQDQFDQFFGGEKPDSNRFEQELIYYLEKLDITEELVRLENHLNYFLESMKTEDLEKGKKLGFISQEIGREINTLGAKANHSGIQRNVVEMKDALEKIKEQLHNIL